MNLWINKSQGAGEVGPPDLARRVSSMCGKKYSHPQLQSALLNVSRWPVGKIYGSSVAPSSLFQSLNLRIICHSNLNLPASSTDVEHGSKKREVEWLLSTVWNSGNLDNIALSTAQPGWRSRYQLGNFYRILTTATERCILLGTWWPLWQIGQFSDPEIYIQSTEGERDPLPPSGLLRRTLSPILHSSWDRNLCWDHSFVLLAFVSVETQLYHHINPPKVSEPDCSN